MSSLRSLSHKCLIEHAMASSWAGLSHCCPFLSAQLPVEVRKEMTDKAIQTVRHFIEKPRRRNSEEDVQEAGDSKVTYADTLSHLERSLAHLDTLSHSFIVSLQNSEQVMK